MNHYTTVLFDLDGTLTDPKVGITSSVAYALKSFGIAVEDLDSLRPFIGPPLKESFMVYYGFSDEQASEAVSKYREYFSVTGIFENEVYEGIPELLSALKCAGRRVILATSKPKIYAEQILEHFGLAKYFDYVAGSELDGTRVKKAEVIDYALAQVGIADRSCAVMVGDRLHDILGAKETGLPSIGVLYGYGNRPELETAGADRIAADVAELERLLLQS
ncbi:MAG: HAD family hydrolase [Lachnospiraceae bacterium]|nr:HAD family hydrolase [Lachnospiraceae bacterium]